MCVVNKIYVSSVVRTVSSFERFQNFVQESRVEFRPKSEGLLFYEPRDLPDTPGARECSLSDSTNRSTMVNFELTVL